MAEGLLCVHAHPDDETITTGGVLRTAHDQGRATHVVTCTDGEEGEIVGVGFDAVMLRPRLAEVRHGELAVALAALGAGLPRLLGYRDSGMMGAVFERTRRRLLAGAGRRGGRSRRRPRP